MQAAEKTPEKRKLSAEELGAFVKAYRVMKKWSQEQLADISGLSVRTVQRVEQGEAASIDTRRAIAKAFGCSDIDTFDNPIWVPTEDGIKAAQEEFERTHVMLPVLPITTGRQLANLAENCDMDVSHPAYTMSRDAESQFALLLDYFRDYRDCAFGYSETAKLEIYDDLQTYIDALHEEGGRAALCAARPAFSIQWLETTSIPSSLSRSLPSRSSTDLYRRTPVGRHAGLMHPKCKSNSH